MKSIALLSLLVLVVYAAEADAVPITVSAGETVTYNVNFPAAGAAPAPPYDTVLFGAQISDFDPNSTGLWRIFGELDGNGPNVFNLTSPFLQAVGFSPIVGRAPVLDGIFSARLTVDTGFVTIDPVAFGFLNGVSTGPVSAELVRPVPIAEPNTAALLSLGLIGLLLVRTRPAA